QRLSRVTNSIGLMLRSPPGPKGEAGVSKHEAAPSFETRASPAPQDEGGAMHQLAGLTNRTTMPAEPLARDRLPVGTILAVTSSLVRPGARSVGARSVAINTKV